MYKNLADTQLTMYDNAGRPETVKLAKMNDRVKKDGANNSHKVIEKLARYKGDNVRALATVHLLEALLASGNETSTDEHSHQWMDENGWTYRTVYLQDRVGNIYAATLKIANGKNRRILYDISNIRKIDTKKAADGVVSSTKTGRDSLINSSYETSVIASDVTVNAKYSAISEDKAQQRAERYLANGIGEIMQRPRRLGSGNYLPNAVLENFFGLLKSDLLYLQNFSP